MKRYYFDYAANTPVDPQVLEAMTEFYKRHFGNASGIHGFARDVQAALDNARATLASSIGAKESEIVITASATESNNTVFKGLAHLFPQKSHVIISSIEHPSVLQTANFLKTLGFEVTEIELNENGQVTPQMVEAALRPETLLVSVMWVNNEVGVMQPIAEIAKVCRKKGVFFHTDAVQGYGKYKIDVHHSNVDFLTASSHKIYGPLGAGLLFVRDGLRFEPLLHGGGHENGRRASTVNVPAVVGFARAVEIYEQIRDHENERIQKWREQIVQAVQQIPDSRINEFPAQAHNIVNISFKNVDGELLAIFLDRQGIAVSTGSACSSGKIKESRILKACHVPAEYRRGTIRVSLGRFNSDDEVAFLLKVLPEAVQKVRKIS